VILRLDDTDLERNTQASIDSIFDGLKWLDLAWDEYYRQFRQAGPPSQKQLGRFLKRAWRIETSFRR